jgi:hypothetical protein
MKNKISPTDPAFPTHGFSSGMNIRTAIAKDAMKGILAARNSFVSSVNEINEITDAAVRMADMLIEKLNN